MTNGRKEYFIQQLSTLHYLHGEFSRKLIHDDSGDENYGRWLDSFGFEVFHTKGRLGFTKAMISAWDNLKEDINEWVFHLEDDFLFTTPVSVDDMIKIILEHDNLAQIALLRQPIGDREKKKGGIIQSHPERYTDCTDGQLNWVEHRVNFTCNPTLYRKKLIYDFPWPDVKDSERHYGPMLYAAGLKCAYFGKSTDQPKVHHIGDVRVGFGH
jgi:hypothetical protein